MKILGHVSLQHVLIVIKAQPKGGNIVWILIFLAIAAVLMAGLARLLEKKPDVSVKFSMGKRGYSRYKTPAELRRRDEEFKQQHSSTSW